MAKTRMYRVTFYNQATIYELYAKRILQSDIYGFVEVAGISFGTTSNMVVDPAEERLKNEFQGVKTTHLPMHSILRIDEVEKEGVAKIRELPKGSGNVSHFPAPLYTPSGPKT